MIFVCSVLEGILHLTEGFHGISTYIVLLLTKSPVRNL